MALAEKFKEGADIPESIGQCADLHQEVKEMRLAMQKKVDAVKVRESEIKRHIIDNLPKGDKGAIGELYRVQVVTKPAATVEDREKFNQFILENARLDLVSRAVSQRAVKEMWENDQEVPGVGRVQSVDLSFRKV